LGVISDLKDLGENSYHKGGAMTAKENLLRVIRRENPRWVPNGLENTITVFPPVVERPAAAGRDAWGVRYDMDDKMGTGTFPAHGGQVIRSIETWREDVHVPDVEAMDFSKLYGGGRLLGKDEIDRDKYLVMEMIGEPSLTSLCRWRPGVPSSANIRPGSTGA
jgi:hypothetical protein